MMFRNSKAALSIWTVTVALLLVPAGSLYAQKDRRSSAPSRSSSSSSHAAPQSHPSSGGHASSGGGSAPHGNSGSSRGPGSGSSSTFSPHNSGSSGGSRGASGGNNAGNAGSSRGGSGNGRPGSSTTFPGASRGPSGGNNSGNATGNRGGNNSGNATGNRGGGNNPGNASGNRGGNGGNTGRQGSSSTFGAHDTGGNRGAGGNNRPGGNTGASNTGGRQFGQGAPRVPGTQVSQTRNGGTVYRSSNGSIREVHTPGGAVIHHAPDGVRRVEVSRPGGRVVVASARGGYVQRPLVYHNVTYVQRTYVVHGVSYARVYRPWVWGGVSFHVYSPVRFWTPGFYLWAYNPWARPVYYSWGWAGTPWFGYYGGWFTPYPYYASPSLWLTDYLIATTLQDAYQARMDAAAAAAANAQANYGATPLTPDVKQAIADEVRRQLDQEKVEAQNSGYNGAPPMFSGNGSHIFVVSSALEVSSQGQACTVTEGDVLQLNGAPPQNATAADVVVLATKGRDCRKGSVVTVGLTDLQEMQNQMRATIDQGLGDLQSKQGQGGLPSLPSNAAGSATNAAYAADVKPDSGAAAEINQASQEADRAERDVVNDSQVSSAPPVTITLGMTVDQVRAALGSPKDIADLGAKKIYVYNSMKVTFVNGKVTDVQ